MGAPTSAKNESHREKVKSVFEGRHSTSYKAFATEVGISWTRVQRILTNRLGKETFVQIWFKDQRDIRFLLATTHLQRWRNEGNAFSDHILTVDVSWTHLFDYQLKWQNVEWPTQASPRKKISWRSQGFPKAMHSMFLDWNELETYSYHPLPFGTTVNGQYYCAPLQD
jgi:hypothetical protein